MELKRDIKVLIVLFVAVWYAARVGIFYVGTTGEMQFEEERSQLVDNIVTLSFLAIGVAGLITLPGVYLLKPWGLWGTIAISAGICPWYSFARGGPPGMRGRSKLPRRLLAQTTRWSPSESSRR